MTDIVVGSITDYSFDKIRPWVNSLDRCGFDGVKLMLCYNIDYDTTEELTKRNYSIIAFSKDEANKTFTYPKPFSIVVERFFHMWLFLKPYAGKFNRLIATDVKDVVFQTNPSEWLDKNLKDKKINVACESIRYKDEEWGKNNLTKSFGSYVYSSMENNLIFNAGTLSGNFDTMRDLFLNVYLLCNGTSHWVDGGGGPDQAALNVLLNIEPYKNITNFAMSESGYAAQLGTTGPQIKSSYGKFLVEKSPILIDDMVCTSDGTPFSIVHQYDRVPEWKTLIEKKYE